MAVIDFQTAPDVEFLENYLSKKSHTVGYEPSMADVDTYAAVMAPQGPGKHAQFAQHKEKERIKQDRVKAYAEKKATNKIIIIKSSIVLDVKPWDDETDMKQLEIQVQTVAMGGLVWGASKLVEIAFGINKLQIMLCYIIG